MENEKLTELPLISHLSELRLRVIKSLIFFIISFIVCYSFKNEIYNLITKPLIDTLKTSGFPQKLIYTKITENFTSTLSIVFSSSLFISIPFFAIQIWLFITPALYREEKRTSLPYLILTPILFLSGVVFAYYLILPTVFDFFVNYGKTEATQTLFLEAKITEYIDFTLSILNAFGICFLTPIFLTLLVKFGILSKETLIKNRKYGIVIIFIMAAILTPPDILSQILLAIPLILMYELSIILSKNKK